MKIYVIGNTCVGHSIATAVARELTNIVLVDTKTDSSPFIVEPFVISKTSCQLTNPKVLNRRERRALERTNNKTK